MAEHHHTPTASIVGTCFAFAGGSIKYLLQMNPANPWENFDGRLLAALITAALSAVVGFVVTQFCKWIYSQFKKRK
jgi:uncharacterized membrane protein YiaA